MAEEAFPLPKWSAESHLQFMSDAGICRRYPDKFGFAAAIPMPDVEGSIAEIRYATEKLGALGVKIASNSDGVYLGDARLACNFAPQSCATTSAFGEAFTNAGEVVPLLNF